MSGKEEICILGTAPLTSLSLITSCASTRIRISLANSGVQNKSLFVFGPSGRQYTKSVFPDRTHQNYQWNILRDFLKFLTDS